MIIPSSHILLLFSTQKKRRFRVSFHLCILT